MISMLICFNVFFFIQLTILFDIVIWIIVSTPGRHLKMNMKKNVSLSFLLQQSDIKFFLKLTGMTLGLLDKRSREVT